MFVTAVPPGWRQRHQTIIAGVIFFLSLVTGPILLASIVWYTIAWAGVPRWVVSLAAVCSLLLSVLIPQEKLPGSHWRVPRSFGRWGYIGFAGSFGLILGAGVLTAIPGAGIYLLVVWAASTSTWVMAVLPLAAFGIARGLTSSVPLLMSGTELYPVRPIATMVRAARRLRPLESVTLAVTFGVFVVN